MRRGTQIWLVLSIACAAGRAFAHHPSIGDPGHAPKITVGSGLNPLEMELHLHVDFKGISQKAPWFELFHEPTLFIARIRAGGSYGLRKHSHSHGDSEIGTSHHAHAGHDHGEEPSMPTEPSPTHHGHHSSDDPSRWGSHVEIQFIPVGIEGYAGQTFVSAGLAQVDLTRDLHVNESLGLRVQAVAVRAARKIQQTRDLDLIVSLVANVLGTAARNYASGEEFRGLHVGAAAVELAERLSFGDFSVWLVAGGGASLAKSFGKGSGAMIDWYTHTEARFDIGRYVRLFLQLARHGTRDTALDASWQSTELMSGIMVHFY